MEKDWKFEGIIVSSRKTPAELKVLDKKIYNKQTESNKRAWGDQWDIKSMDYLMEGYESIINSWYNKYLLNKKCLFLGCGNGSETICLRPFVRGAVGIDISIEQIKKAKRNSYFNQEFIVADAENLPFKDGSFDAVFCKSILHHLTDLSKSLTEIKRIMNNGGVLFIAMEPSILNPIAYIGRRFFPTNIHTPGETPFIPYKFNKIISNHGFVNIAYRPFCFISQAIPILTKFCNIRLFLLMNIFLRTEKILFKSPMKNMCWFFAGVWKISNRYNLHQRG